MESGGDLDCTLLGDPKLGMLYEVVGEVGENGDDVAPNVDRDSASGFISIGLCGAPKGEVTLSMRLLSIMVWWLLWTLTRLILTSSWRRWSMLMVTTPPCSGPCLAFRSSLADLLGLFIPWVSYLLYATASFFCFQLRKGPQWTDGAVDSRADAKPCGSTTALARICFISLH